MDTRFLLSFLVANIDGWHARKVPPALTSSIALSSHPSRSTLLPLYLSGIPGFPQSVLHQDAAGLCASTRTIGEQVDRHPSHLRNSNQG